MELVCAYRERFGDALVIWIVAYKLFQKGLTIYESAGN
jgi:ABC-type uncharacterized transport system permease subunit